MLGGEDVGDPQVELRAADESEPLVAGQRYTWSIEIDPKYHPNPVGHSPRVRATFEVVDPAFRNQLLKSIPTTGIIGLVVLWFSIEEKAKIVFLFLGAIFYMIVLVKNAVASVRDDYVRVAEDLGATPWQVLTRVLLPGALPQIWEAVAVANGIMWTYIVLAEFINSNEDQLGVGFLLQLGSRANDSGKVFGMLIIIALIASLTDWVLQAIRRRFFPW